MTNWRYHWAQSSANETNKKMNTSLACVRRGRDFFGNFSYCLFLIQYLLFSLSFFLSLANLCRAWNKTLETSRFLLLPSEQSRAEQAVSSFRLMAKLIKTKWRRAVRLTYKLMARYVQLLASLWEMFRLVTVNVLCWFFFFLIKMRWQIRQEA